MPSASLSGKVGDELADRTHVAARKAVLVCVADHAGTGEWALDLETIAAETGWSSTMAKRAATWLDLAGWLKRRRTVKADGHLGSYVYQVDADRIVAVAEPSRPRLEVVPDPAEAEPVEPVEPAEAEPAEDVADGSYRSTGPVGYRSTGPRMEQGDRSAGGPDRTSTGSRFARTSSDVPSGRSDPPPGMDPEVWDLFGDPRQVAT